MLQNELCKVVRRTIVNMILYFLRLERFEFFNANRLVNTDWEDEAKETIRGIFATVKISGLIQSLIGRSSKCFKPAKGQTLQSSLVNFYSK